MNDNIVAQKIVHIIIIQLITAFEHIYPRLDQTVVTVPNRCVSSTITIIQSNNIRITYSAP